MKSRWPAYDFYEKAKISYTCTSTQQPPLGQNKVVIIEVTFVQRFKQESMNGLFVHQDKKGGHCEEVAGSGGSTVVA